MQILRTSRVALKVLSTAAALVTLNVARAASPACTAIRTEVQVSENIRPPQLDLSKNAVEIDRLKFGNTLPIDPKFTETAGLTVATITVDQHIGTMMSGDDDGPYCIWPSVIAVQLVTAPIIYANASHGACRRDSAIAHEMEHAAIDRQLIERYTPIFERRTARMAEAIGNVSVSSKDRLALARESIEEKIRAIISVTYEEMARDRLSAQRAHDSPEEYHRLSLACPIKAEGS